MATVIRWWLSDYFEYESISLTGSFDIDQRPHGKRIAARVSVSLVIILCRP